MKMNKFSFYLFVTVICFILITSVCSYEHPEFSEYELVGSMIIKELKHGHIFLNSDVLSVVYRTRGDDAYLTRMRVYDISNPIRPKLIRINSLMPEIGWDMRVVHSKTQAFFYQRYWQDIKYLDLETSEITEFNTEYAVLAMTILDSLLYLNTSNGLVILDVTDPTNPLELYNEHDTVAYYGYSVIAVADTVLFEQTYYLYRFRWWNIKTPQAPSLISEGYHYIDGSLYSIITNNYLLIAASEYVCDPCLYRCTRNYADTLTIEETEAIGYGINGLAVVDTSVYLMNWSELMVLQLDDFSQQQNIRPIALGNPSYISFGVCDHRIFTLCREHGILVYERSTP
ncbi:MAG: hypothetical protein WBB67_03400 [bacterium]